MNSALKLGATECLDECPACGEETYHELPLPGIVIGRKCFSDVLPNLLLVRCLRCGHVYQKVRPTGELLDRFYQTTSEYAPFGHDRDAIGVVADCLRLDFINRFSRGGILDYGGGGGRFARSVRDAGRSASVVELSPIGREQCASIGVAAYANIESVPAGQYDVISMMHVLEHVDFPKETLRALSDALPPNGGVYIEVPNLRSLRARIFPVIAKRCPHDCWFRAFPSHLHGFTKKSLSATMKGAGLQPVEWTTYGGGFEFENAPAYSPSVVADSDAGAAGAPAKRTPFRVSLKKRAKQVLFESLLLGENLCVFCVKQPVDGNIEASH